MRFLKTFAAAVVASVLLFAPAVAQTNPGLTKGQVLTAGQWNALFAGKQDTLGYTPLNSSGGVMTGRLVTASSGASTAGFNLIPGSTPASPTDGDLWTTSSGLFVQINGVTVGPLAGSGGTGVLPVVNGGTGTSTVFTTGAVVFAGASGIYSQDAAFSWDNTLKKLNLNLSGTAMAAAETDTGFQMDGADGFATTIFMDSHGATAAIDFRQQGGTKASPTATATGATMGQVNFQGWDGTAYGKNARVRAIAEPSGATWTLTDHGVGIGIFTTAPGTTSLSEKFHVFGNGGIATAGLSSLGAGTFNLTGGVVVGAATGSNKGAGTVNVSSAYYVNGRSSTSEVFYASNYGAVCDNATNDTAHIQAAITAAQVKGGIVQLPAGQCILNSGLTASSAAGEIIIRGVGMGAGGGQVSNASNTQLLANFASGDVLFAVSDFGVVVEDLQFNSNVGPRSSGAAVHIKAANPLTTANSNSIVRNVSFSNQVVDIQCTVCAWPTITNTYHQAFVSHGVLIDYVASAVESGGGLISGNYFFGNATDTCITSHAGYFKISHNLLVNCQYGISIAIDQRAAGNPVIDFNTIENCVVACIIAQNSGGILASMMQITDNQFSIINATAQSVIQILPNSGGSGPWIDGIQIARNIARNSLTAGGGAWTYNIQSGTNVQIVGNQSDHLAGDTSNMFLFGNATDLVAPVLVSNNTEQGSTTGARYVNPTAQITIIDNIGLPFASMPALAANGSQILVTNGAPSSNPLTGASTGAMGLRLNSAWLGQGVIAYGAGVAALLTGPASGTGGPAGTISPTFTGAPILAAPSATTLIVGSSVTLPASDIAVISGNATTLPTVGGGALLHLGSANSGSAALVIDSFAATPSVIYRRADTSAAAPSALQSGDTVFNNVAQGYGATAYAATARMFFRSIAAENWTDSAQGMYATIGTTPTGTNAAVEAVRFQASGGFSVGTTTDPGVGAILANTSIKATTSVTAVTAYNINTKLAWSATSPSVSSGFCTSPSISANNGTAAFTITIGSACAASTGVLTMPAASVGWACHFNNVTTPASNTPYQTASTTTSVNVTNYARTTGLASNWTASEVVTAECTAY